MTRDARTEAERIVDVLNRTADSEPLVAALAAAIEVDESARWRGEPAARPASTTALHDLSAALSALRVEPKSGGQIYKPGEYLIREESHCVIPRPHNEPSRAEGDGRSTAERWQDFARWWLSMRENDPEAP